MQRRPGDPRRQMTLVRRHRGPVATLLEDPGEGRFRTAAGEMTHDAERHLVQFEQNEASRPGQILTSATAGALGATRTIMAPFSYTVSGARGNDGGRFQRTPPIRLHFGYGRSMCG